MEFVELRMQIEAARRFEHTVDGIKFRLRMPEERKWRSAVQRQKDGSGNIVDADAQRAVLDISVIGWDGLKESHLLPGGSDEPVAFSEEAKAELLDNRLDITAEITLALCDRREADRARMGEERKN